LIYRWFDILNSKINISKYIEDLDFDTYGDTQQQGYFSFIEPILVTLV
jgi:hypothetical protein